jgi:hypothetical protein
MGHHHKPLGRNLGRFSRSGGFKHTDGPYAPLPAAYAPRALNLLRPPDSIPAETLSKLGAVHGADRGGPRDPQAGVQMTAVVYKLRDYQNPRDIERLYADLEKEAAKIIAEVVPYEGKGIDGMTFTDNDPS